MAPTVIESGTVEVGLRRRYPWLITRFIDFSISPPQ